MMPMSLEKAFPNTSWRTWLVARLIGASLLVATAFPPTTAAAQPEDTPAADPDAANLLDLSLDQLMNIEVTSVSKKPESLSTTAAAIYVITQEDIRRSGMSSVPELLRMVPGLQVARSSAHNWAVGARGYNEAFPGKMLVLVDGRSVYSPVLAGVFWEMQELPLHDIERIEVIRGPGATIWGANAVDGVINIITKNARDTLGLVVSASGGAADDAGTIAASYGGKLSDTAFFRVYAKELNRDALRTSTGEHAGDSWRATRGGVRLDWTPSATDTVSLGAEYFHERSNIMMSIPNLVGPTIATPQVQIGRNKHILGNWKHQFSPRSDLTTQIYYDSTSLQFVAGTYRFDTYDMEMRHHVALGTRHDLVWGGGYRRIKYRSDPSTLFSLTQPTGSETIYNIFAQDDFALTEALHLIAGLKLEHNSFTGWENEPTVRVRWSITPNHTVWGAISKAVRTPSIGDNFARVNVYASPATQTSPPLLSATFGNPAQQSERLTSWQIGYRGVLKANLTVDATGFYNRYTRSLSYAVGASFPEATPPPSHILVPVYYGNRAEGELYGMEILANWQVSRTWKLSGSYSLNLGQISPIDPGAVIIAGRSPHHGAQIRSHLDLPGHTEFDAAIYYVSKFQQATTTPTAIPAYTRLDLRFGWRATDHLSFSLSGQNLLQSRHREHSLELSPQTEVPRSVNLTVTARF